MQSAEKEGFFVLQLDRPNPNGEKMYQGKFSIDNPTLEPGKIDSFINENGE
jgi:hypothetical protein